MKFLLTQFAAAWVAMLLCAVSTELAASDDAEATAAAPAGELPSIDEFLSVQAQLRKDMEAGQYGEFSAEDMQLIDTSQATLQELLSGVENPADLPMENRIEAYNAQEAIKAVLAENVKQRPICRRERSVGSHISKTVCYTPRQKQVMEEHAEQVFRNMSFPLPASD